MSTNAAAPAVSLRKVEERTVTYTARSGASKTVALPTFEVIVDGEAVGRVERAVVTRETSSAGRMYVNTRWDGLAWVASSSVRRGYRFGYHEHATRGDSVAALLGYVLGETPNAVRALAKAAKVVR